MSCTTCPLMYVMIQPNYYPSMHVVSCMSCYNPETILPYMSWHACRQKRSCRVCPALTLIPSYHACRVMHVVNYGRTMYVVSYMSYLNLITIVSCMSWHASSTIVTCIPRDVYRVMYVVACLSTIVTCMPCDVYRAH